MPKSDPKTPCYKCEDREVDVEKHINCHDF